MSIWTTRKLAVLAATVALLALGLYLAFGIFGLQAAFPGGEVNEEFVVQSETSKPPETSETSGAVPERGDTQGGESTVSSGEAEGAGEPPTEPVLVSSGEIRAVEYEGGGAAEVYRLEDGSHTLHLEGLNVDSGPDLYLYAVAADAAWDSETVEEAGFINLGRLRSNVGDQAYPLPAEFDPAEHEAISVWCQQFSANFVAASLQSAS